MRPLVFLITILFLANACHKGNGNMVDDENPIDTIPVDTIELNQDSLNCAKSSTFQTVPNGFFSNYVDEVLIFSDSTQSILDTIVCTRNEISYQFADGWVTDICLTYLEADYLTSWLPMKDSTILEFRKEIGYFGMSPWFASIIGGDFCADFFNDGVFDVDSMQVNDYTIDKGIRFECQTENCDCNVAESLIIEYSKGLVAFRRNGVWFTRYN